MMIIIVGVIAPTEFASTVRYYIKGNLNNPMR